MTTSVKADDKSRLIIRGVKRGQTYLVQQTADGWYVMPEPETPRRRGRRNWAGSHLGLAGHLDALEASGFRMPEPIKKKVGPCRF